MLLGVHQLGSVAGRRSRRDLAVLDLERVNPALSAGEDADGIADLDELGLGEVLLQIRPQDIVRPRRVPGNRVGVAQGDLLALGEARRVFVVLEVREPIFADGLLSGPDRALDRSIGAVERRRDPHPKELLQLVVDNPTLEDVLPGIDEATDHRGDVRPDQLDLGTGCADRLGFFDERPDLRVAGSTYEMRAMGPPCVLDT